MPHSLYSQTGCLHHVYCSGQGGRQEHSIGAQEPLEVRRAQTSKCFMYPTLLLSLRCRTAVLACLRAWQLLPAAGCRYCTTLCSCMARLWSVALMLAAQLQLTPLSLACIFDPGLRWRRGRLWHWLLVCQPQWQCEAGPCWQQRAPEELE